MKLIVLILFSFQWAYSAQVSTSYDFEIRTAPVAVLAKWWTFDFSFAVNPNWAVGPSAILYSSPRNGGMLAPSYDGYAIGGHVYHYMNSFSDNGWYWGNHFYYETYDSFPHNAQGTYYELKGFKLNSKFGYQTMSLWAVNLLTGFGFEFRSYADQKLRDPENSGSTSMSDQSKTLPYIEIKMGYKF